MTDQAPSESSTAVRLGAQLWLERDDDDARVEALIATAAQAGLTELRVFLMWNWMQPDRDGDLDFRLYDAVFAAAERHGIRIKATLTANSGPWWTGAPDVLHTFTMTLDPSVRPAMARYIRESVERYAEHPALGQWILWNEPINPVDGKDGPPVDTTEARAIWAELLEAEYGSIDDLNRRWRTGFDDWNEVPLADDLPNVAHRNSAWRGFTPRLLDYRLRETVLRRELAWVASEVRSVDTRTPICVNPNGLFQNLADAGYDLAQLGSVTDVLGASFHAPWSFTYARRSAHLGLIAAGVGLLRSAPGDHRVEVTEMQIGNTYYAGEIPLGISRSQVAASYLTARFAGAESATGWCLNTRELDFEAGEWGLLDDDDTIGDRSRGVRDAATVLESVGDRLGTWSAGTPDVLVLVDEVSQAVEMQMAMVEDPATGRGRTTAMRGATLLAVELLTMGYAAAVAPISALSARSQPRIVVVSHLIAWSAEFADCLASLASSGTTVLIDVTAGQFDPEARRWAPGPGTLASAIGAHSAGLESSFDGTSQFSLRLNTEILPAVASVRSRWVIGDPAWRAAGPLQFEDDDSPVVWSRSFGAGRILHSRINLASAALRDHSGPRLALRTVLDLLDDAHHPRPVVPRSPDTFVLPLDGARSRGWAVIAGTSGASGGRTIRVDVEPGTWHELVTGTCHVVGPDRALRLSLPDDYGVVIPVGTPPDSTRTESSVPSV